MSGKYAASTDVPSDRSRAEIEKTLMRYGAEQFAYMTSSTQAAIAFVVSERQVRLTLTLPDRNSPEFTRTTTGRAKVPTAVAAAYEQAVRQRWRALALVVKAKLEAITVGISTLEMEFGMSMVLPDGQTIGQTVLPRLSEIYRGQKMELLP